MREILFKAKEFRGGWHCGDPITLVNERICGIKTKDLVCNRFVCPRDSLCEYTGQKDRNDVYIFENDIVAARFDKDYPENVSCGVVRWKDYGWHIQWLEELFIDDPDSAYDALEMTNELTVVGNIIDSPEVLEYDFSGIASQFSKVVVVE